MKGHAQSVIFLETMGTVSGTTSIAAHESANGFDNTSFTMTSGGAANPADLRSTSASTGYSGASGEANIFFTSSSGQRGFAIEGINASAYTNLNLSFAVRKEGGAGTDFATFNVEYWDGSTYQPITVSGLPTSTNGAGWYYISNVSLPSAAQISGLRIRFLKSGTIACRLDDVKLEGTSTSSITTTSASFGPFCNTTSHNISVAYSSSGSFSGDFKVQLSNASGIFPNNASDNIIGTGSSSPLSAAIPSSQAAGSGYRVRVVNDNPVTLSGNDNGSNINMVVPASISAHPASATINENKNTSFSVTASNATGYQWEVNTGSGWATLSDGGVYSGVSNATLNLTGVLQSYTGNQYRCVVSSASTCTTVTSNSAILTVNQGPCGQEDFSNLPSTNSSTYLGRSWIGTDGLTWTAEGARTDQTINGKAITFNTTGNRWVASPTYTNGIGILTFDYVRAFTGTGSRTLQVWVNGSKVGSDITVSSTSDDVVTYSNAINITGNVQLEIRSTGAAQVKLDNISWTCACSGTPAISAQLSSFSDVEGESFTINFNRGDGLKRLVVVKQDDPVTGTPVNGTIYTASSAFGTGDQLSAGEYVVYYGFGDNVTVTGLDRNTTYHVAIFESCEEEYKATAPATGSQATTNALITVTMPDEMEYELGSGPSVSQTFTVSGSGLVPAAGNLTISAPANFQVSTASGGPYSNSVSLAYTGSLLSTTTIYVRLVAGLDVNLYAGNANVSGGAATAKEAALNGRVFPGACSDLFFSEYVEGTGLNKLLEIYNPSGTNISLANYQIRIYSNGSSSPTSTTSLSGSLPAYSTFIIANPGESWPGTPGLTNTNIDFNGDDAIELYRLDINAPVDIIGRIGEQPDDGGWFSGQYSTLNHTLVRKPSVKSGVRINPVSGFPALGTEWLLMDLNQFFFLGDHQSVCQNSNVTWIENISPLPLCNGSDITIDYAAVGIFPAGNQFTLQLSSSAGTWGSPTSLATFPVSGTNPSGSINVMIPPATTPGTGYLLRLTASNPSGTARVTTQPMPVVFSPENVSGASVILFSPGQANVSWDNPTSCYDEIVVFMNENSPVSITPSGDGSVYTVYTPAGCSTPDNAVIYKGAGSSVQVAGLDNNITYHFKIFTRKGTSWSSGVSVILTSGQNVFDPGDLVILAINPADSCGLGGDVDIVYLMSFRDILPGTSIDVTDNSWERENTGKWGGTEGFYRLTYTGTTISKGAVFKLYFDGNFDIGLTQALNPDWNIVKYGTGSINFSVLGDQIFLLQGGSWENTVPSEHNATYTGGRAIYAFDSSPSWVSLAGSSSKSGLPVMARCVEHQPFTVSTPRFMAYTGVTTSADRVTWLERLRSSSNWTGYSTCSAIASYLSGFPSSLTITDDASSSTQWLGSQGINWFDCYNWQSRVIPTASLNANISNTTNKPRIDASAAYAYLYNGKAATAHLDIQNGGRLDMNGNADHYLEVNGNLTILNGGQLNMNDGNTTTADGTLVLTGNWTNNAGGSGFDEGQSKVILKGNSTQNLSINASLTEAFHQLVVQKPLQAAVLLSSPVSISSTGQLEFKCGGYLNTNGHSVTVLNPDPSNAIIGYEKPNDSGVYENDRYIIGQLIRQIDRVAAYEFPVGDVLSGERYNPFVLDITNAAPGNGAVSGQFIPGSPGTINDRHTFYCPFSSTRKFHEFTGMTGEGWWRLSGPDYGYNITLHPNLVNLNTFPNDSLLEYRDNYRAIRATTGTGGNTWPSSAAREGDLCVVGSYYAVPGAGYTGFSDFGVPGGNGNTTALPIELLHFRATAVDNHKVLTSWVTGTERNNDHFTVERSKNAIDFEAVGVVPGAGNSNTVLFYEFEDPSPYTGVSYYRLKQTDFDGSFSYSRIEQVFIAPAGTISVYPNPASDLVIVELPVSVFPYKLQLFDLVGREVFDTRISGIQQYRLSLENIPSGLYVLKVTDGSVKKFFKLLKQ